MLPEGLRLVRVDEALLLRLQKFLDTAERALTRFAPEPFPLPDFSISLALRWEGRGESGSLKPVLHPHLVDLDHIIGVDYAKSELLRNTEQFVSGYTAHNVLLWGERGTGKSSCVKGLLKPFGGRGLRIIEVQRGDLMSLPAIAAIVRDLPYRFIVFCDDLAFGEGDTSYQELKSLLDGGVEARPDNLLIYATSNRRHLLPEHMDDRQQSEIHPEEAVSEKLSLADRFGITLSFYPFNQKVYLDIVEKHASDFNITMTDDFRKESLQWALYKGQRSGRAARQFVEDLAGRLRVKQVE